MTVQFHFSTSKIVMYTIPFGVYLCKSYMGFGLVGLEYYDISKINRMRDEEQHMQEEREEGSIMTEEMNKPLEESEVGPTSIDVTDEQASLVEAFPAEHEVQEQNKQIEQVQEESGISKNKSKRRVTSYLSNISKQVEKQGNQISKITMMIQSILKQKQTKSTKGQEQANHLYNQ